MAVLYGSKQYGSCMLHSIFLYGSSVLFCRLTLSVAFCSFVYLQLYGNWLRRTLPVAFL